jgi:hypothetical protein
MLALNRIQPRRKSNPESFPRANFQSEAKQFKSALGGQSRGLRRPRRVSGSGAKRAQFEPAAQMKQWLEMRSLSTPLIIVAILAVLFVLDRRNLTVSIPAMLGIVAREPVR